MSLISFVSLLLFSYIFFVCGVCCKTKYLQILFSFLFVSFFAFLSAIRFESVPDTIEYIEHYNAVASLPFNDFGYYIFEPGYVFLVKIYHRLFSNGGYSGFFFFLAVLNCFLILCGIKTYYKAEKDVAKIIVVSLVYYVSYYGLYFNFIVLRFGLGASFFLLSLANAKYKNIGALCFYGLALFCHTSFLIVIPFYLFALFYNKNKPKTFYYLWLLVIALIYYCRLGRFVTSFLFHVIAQIGGIIGRYSYYLNDVSLGNSKISIKFTLNFILAFIFVKYGNLKDSRYVFLLLIYLSGLMIYACFSSILLIDRVSDVCLVSGVLLIPSFYRALKTWGDKLILYFPVCIMNMIFIIRIINR